MFQFGGELGDRDGKKMYLYFLNYILFVYVIYLKIS